MPPELIPGRQLRHQLRQATTDDVAEGVYSALTNDRRLTLGRDATDISTRMVSLHEACHATLNMGTIFGTCMILAGSLADAGFAEFGPLTEQLVDAAIITHETYATLLALAAVSDGIFDYSQLESYPDYQQLLDRFAEHYPVHTRPFVAALCLEACARVAMQTDLGQRWAELPCLLWPGVSLDERQRPDWRFALLLDSDAAATAIDAIDSELRIAGAPLSALIGPIAPRDAAVLAGGRRWRQNGDFCLQGSRRWRIILSARMSRQQGSTTTEA